MTPAESQIAGLLAPLIAQGGTVALLAMFVMAMLRGYVITKHHHDEIVSELRRQVDAGAKREAELLDLASSGTAIAEMANRLAQQVQPIERRQRS